MKTKKLLISAFVLLGFAFFSCNDDNLESSSIVYGNGVTDIEGNEYRSVIIGKQEWMAENLRTTKYNDGTEIPHGLSDIDWDSGYIGAHEKPAYCWYNNDREFAESKNYGALYNAYTIEEKNICPSGWHIPSNSEWETLELFIKNDGYEEEEGKALRSKSGWSTEDGNDIYGLNILPAGSRSKYGFSDGDAYLLCSTWWLFSFDGGDWNSDYEQIHYFSRGFSSAFDCIYNNDKGIIGQTGVSVRCIKN